jgi:hypothetical protein
MNDEEIAFLKDTMSRSQSLMTHLNGTHEDPFEALASCILVLAALAKGIDMPLDDLVVGVKSAYTDMETVSSHDTLQ